MTIRGCSHPYPHLGPLPIWERVGNGMRWRGDNYKEKDAGSSIRLERQAEIELAEEFLVARIQPADGHLAAD